MGPGVMADAWGLAWGTSWGGSWGLFGFREITDTDILQKPVNYALAGEQRIKDRGREWDIRAANRKESPRVMRSGARKLGGEAPSFTVKTGNRGYD